MSLVSWFKNASTAKKVAVVSIAAINGLTFINTGITSHKLHMSDPSILRESMLLNVVAGPMTTPLAWIGSQKIPDSGSVAEGTPIPFLANQTKKILPEKIDTGLGIAVTVAGIPGAIAGHMTGVSTAVIRQVATPQVRYTYP